MEEEEEKAVPSEKQRGNANNTVPEQKGEKMKKKKHTYHVVTRRLAFALLVIRLAFGLQRKPPLFSKIEISATR